MKTRVFFAGLLTCLSLSHSQPSAYADAERKISVNIQNRTLREAMQQIADVTGMRYQLQPDVPNLRLSLNIRDVGVQSLVRLMLRQVSTQLGDKELTFNREGDLYIIGVGPAPKENLAAPQGTPELPRELAESPKFRSKLAFAVKGEALELVADRIFADTGLRYRVQPELSKIPVTLSVRDVPAVVVARLVVQQVSAKQPGVSIWRDGRTYVLGVKGQGGKLPDQP